MSIITHTTRTLRKRNFEQLRPYTAERIQAKCQGIPVEVDKEVLLRENSTLENYGGYIEDETDLLFVEEDVDEVEESQEVQRRHSEQELRQRATNVNHQNVRMSSALSNKQNVSKCIIRKNVDSSATSHQYSTLSDDIYQESSGSEDDDNIDNITVIEDDSNHESNNEEEVETEFNSNHDDPVSISSDESIMSNNRDECELNFISSDDEIINDRIAISQRGISSQSSRLRSEQNLVSKKLKNLLQWADTTPVTSPNDKNFPIEKYLELLEELHKNIYAGNPWPEQARSLIRDLMMYWAGWRPTNNGINNCYKILVKLIEVVPTNVCNVPDIPTLTQRYLDLTLQLLGRIIDDTPIDHVNDFILKFNKHTRVLIDNLRCKGVQDKANENIAVSICSVIALINKKPMSEYISNKSTYISKRRNQEWIIKSLMLLNRTLKMLTSYGTGTKQALMDLFELLKRKCRNERMDPEIKIKAKECLETVKSI